MDKSSLRAITHRVKQFLAEANTRTASGVSGGRPSPTRAPCPQSRPASGARQSWARLIAKVYQVDPLLCVRCGKRMAVVAFVTDAFAIRRILDHVGLSPVEPEDKKIAVGTVMRSLRNFFRSATLAEAYAAGRENWLTVEDLVSFHVDDVEVFLRMDLAYRDRNGRVVIVDWKTGRGEGRFGEVQMAGYALYAAERGWVASAEEIETELAYLVIPRYRRRSVDGRKLEHARTFIRKSAGRMKALLLDPAANLARLEDFAMIDRPRICRRCNFRRLCFPRAEEKALAIADESAADTIAARGVASAVPAMIPSARGGLA